MIELDLPWPSAMLSPNARVHPMHRHRFGKRYRNACCLSVLAMQPRPRVPAGRLRVELVFVPPKRHHYDKDNLVARMKSGLDGLADGLGVNDHVFDLAPPQILAPECQLGRVRVRITPAEGGS
jgi:crossover junction endodeoxyribonuclease RusA